MNKHFIQVTNGLLPVFVLALLAVAFIAGQARANFAGADGRASEALMTPAAVISAEHDYVVNAEALSRMMDAIAEFPGSVELHVKVLGELSLVEPGATLRTARR